MEQPVRLSCEHVPSLVEGTRADETAPQVMLPTIPSERYFRFRLHDQLTEADSRSTAEIDRFYYSSECHFVVSVEQINYCNWQWDNKKKRKEKGGKFR